MRFQHYRQLLFSRKIDLLTGTQEKLTVTKILFLYLRGMESGKRAVRTATISMIANFLLAVLKYTVGVLGNSYALIADAIESSGDVFSSLLVVVGLKFANKPPDENHPYGHGKIEPLITFAVVGFLILAGVLIVVESVEHIQTPHKAPSAYTLWVLGGIILIKEGFYRFVSKHSKQTGSTALKADAWHHRSDAITSLCAFVGILIAVIFGDKFAQADDWAALVAAAIIFFNAYHIFRPAFGEVMDEHIYPELVEEIRKYSKEVDGVIDTEKCHVRKSGMLFYIDLHITVNGHATVDQGHTIAHNLKAHLMHKIPSIADILVHVEPD